MSITIDVDQDPLKKQQSNMVIGKNIMQNKNLASNNEREIKSLKTDIHNILII